MRLGLNIFLMLITHNMYKWAQITIRLISKANFFTSGLTVQLMFKNVSGLVVEASFFSQSANLLE